MNRFLNFFNSYIINKRIFILIDKLLNKINIKTKSKDNLIWIKDNTVDLKKILSNIDNKVYNESLKFSKSLEVDSKEKLKNKKLGGGGNYILLYFLVRYYNPDIVVETGVAAGFSSSSILNAFLVNKKGHLYSSDFPYIKNKNSINDIGILVDKSLKKRWSLFTKGDKFNLIEILSLIKNEKIDIIHYDSDKTYKGKEFFFNKISKSIRKNTIIIIDDIQDDLFFKEYVKKTDTFYIFKFKNKYLGMINNKI